MPNGADPAVGIVNSSPAAIVPPVVMRPILLAPASVNQRLPSGPGAMWKAPAAAVGTGYSFTTGVESVVARATLLGLAPMANQRFPSGPGVMPAGAELGVRAKSVIAPAVVVRPSLEALSSVNQRLPSDPGTMLRGTAPAVGIRKSVAPVPAGVMRPILPT